MLLIIFFCFLSGQCTFENGFCGLKHHNSADSFRWSLHSGFTPSAETGPKHDHTTYSEKGVTSTSAFEM